MSHRLYKRVALALAVAALATPAAQAGITRYDGYKSSYPQLHQLGVSAGVPSPDLKSSYPQLHEVLLGAVRTPTVGATGNSGVNWRDAGLGALIGFFAAGLLGSVALRLRGSRLPALR